jgi:hypothetical protein
MEELVMASSYLHESVRLGLIAPCQQKARISMYGNEIRLSGQVAASVGLGKASSVAAL